MPRGRLYREVRIAIDFQDVLVRIGQDWILTQLNSTQFIKKWTMAFIFMVNGSDLIQQFDKMASFRLNGISRDAKKTR